ncbi:thiazole synthase, partial [Salmonella enterica subsp. enterica serovar Typhimurium]|nr:thiazole synthase [Salmonella enterica subsp. enterica serovar Typhimurium]
AGELARQSGLATPASIVNMQAQASSPLTQYLGAF